LGSFFYKKQATQITLGGGYTQYDGKQYGFVKWAQYGVPNDYRWYLDDSKKKDFNSFVKCQQQIGRLHLYGDIQVRTVSYDINGFRKNPTLHPSNNYNFFNPKVGFSYQVSKNESGAQRLYASVAIANKEPNHDDFEAATTDQPKPEQLTDYEMGYEIRAKKWTAHANVYYMNYKDQLVLTGKINDVGAYVRTNVPSSFRSGIELVGAYQFAKWLRIDGNATFSQNKIKDFTEFVDDYDNGGQQAINHGTTDIAFSPNQTFFANVHFIPFSNLKFWRHFSIDLIQKYVSEQYLDNTSNGKRIINPYSLTDCRIQFSIKPKMVKEVGFTIALNNLFNKMYESNGYTYSYIYGQTFTTQNFYYPQAGFNWLMGVSLKW
jgi:iron complex outermembrane receptor protein